MAGDKYRIHTPTIALFLKEGGHVSETIPVGAIVTLESEPMNGNRLIQVRWAEKTVLMFTQDIRARAEKVG